jgi:hypothetical protein
VEKQGVFSALFDALIGMSVYFYILEEEERVVAK